MATIQIVIDPSTDAELAYLAGLAQKRKADIARDLLTEAISHKFEQSRQEGKPIFSGTTGQTQSQAPSVFPGRRGHQVLYTGSDPRLQSGQTYSSYAEILRMVRPDLAKLWPDGKLYNAKAHGGDNAESILERNEPGIYKDLVRK
jgi:hypothetical protein